MSGPSKDELDAGVQAGSSDGSAATPAEAPAAQFAADGQDDKPRKRVRPHPYASEDSPAEEQALDARRVTALWLGLALGMIVAGLWLGNRFSPYVPGGTMTEDMWKAWTNVPLFSGLILLGFGFIRQTWSKNITQAGWILFAFYWSLTAQDLLWKEGQDYFNFGAALVGTLFFTYLAYHQWLSHLRGVRNDTVHFLNVATFVAAGSYFLIDKVMLLRVALIKVVSANTKWGLDLFGQGSSKGLIFLTDPADNKAPTTFFYPEKYCNPGRGDDVGQWCRENGYDLVHTFPDPPTNWFQSLLQWTPASEDLLIVPVSIILACTAVQSIMLFVGLFAGTNASLKRKVYASLIVGAIVYVLNLVRNVGIIWFYGQGHASFWVMHNAIGKGGSLLAMIGIAFAVFRWFPEFFHALVGVLDLPDRDGPIERTLKIGRRRPESAPPAVPTQAR